jgi:hypothetical protein
MKYVYNASTKEILTIPAFDDRFPMVSFPTPITGESISSFGYSILIRDDTLPEFDKTTQKCLLDDLILSTTDINTYIQAYKVVDQTEAELEQTILMYRQHAQMDIKNSFINTLATGSFNCSFNFITDARRSGHNDDLSNLIGAIKTASINKTDIDWKDANNNIQVLTVEQGNTLVDEYYQYFTALNKKKIDLIAAINIAKTISDIINIKW